MSNWQMRIDLSDFWHKYPDELTLHDISKKLVAKLKLAHPEVKKRFPRYSKSFITIIKEFELFANGEVTLNSNVEEFNQILDRLYDWADTSLDNEVGGKKLCWINTVSQHERQ